jgi:cell shape-determining protein MreD
MFLMIFIVVVGLVSLIFGILHSPKDHDKSSPIGIYSSDFSFSGILVAFLFKYLSRFLGSQSYWFTKILYFLMAIFCFWIAFFELDNIAG